MSDTSSSEIDINYLNSSGKKLNVNGTTNKQQNNTQKKPMSSDTDFYFNYTINQDLRDRKFRTQDGYQTFFSQELPLISDNSEFSNAFEVSKFKKLSTRSDTIGKISFFAKTITGLSDDVRISKRLNIPTNKFN